MKGHIIESEKEGKYKPQIVLGLRVNHDSSKI